jgi:hypothetical protein
MMNAASCKISVKHLTKPSGGRNCVPEAIGFLFLCQKTQHFFFTVLTF